MCFRFVNFITQDIRPIGVVERPFTAAAAHDLVGHFKKGMQSKNWAKTEARAAKCPQHELFQDVSTCWNLTCLMLERLL